MPITQNKKGGKAVVIATANETLSPSDFNINDEVTTELSITGLYWSAAGTPIVIERDGDVLLTLNGSGSWNLYEFNIAIDLGTDDLDLTVPAGSSLIVEVRKKSEFISQYYGR